MFLLYKYLSSENGIFIDDNPKELNPKKGMHGFNINISNVILIDSPNNSSVYEPNFQEQLANFKVNEDKKKDSNDDKNNENNTNVNNTNTASISASNAKPKVNTSNSGSNRTISNPKINKVKNTLLKDLF